MSKTNLHQETGQQTQIYSPNVNQTEVKYQVTPFWTENLQMIQVWRCAMECGKNKICLAMWVGVRRIGSITLYSPNVKDTDGCDTYGHDIDGHNTDRRDTDGRDTDGRDIDARLKIRAGNCFAQKNKSQNERGQFFDKKKPQGNRGRDGPEIGAIEMGPSNLILRRPLWLKSKKRVRYWCTTCE